MMFFSAPLFLSLLGWITLVRTHPVNPSGPVVHLGYSKYQGVSLENGISQWLGIRYAAPPVGDLRFRAPQDPIKNTELQTADKVKSSTQKRHKKKPVNKISSQHGDVCLSTSTGAITSGNSEDCLVLDVYAPTNAGKKRNQRLPVYIYIQGGGFNSNSNPNYNGSGLITASGLNVVIVTFNYRVGLYGFLASREVKEDGDFNNGLKDQRKVFEWVQKYIHKV